MKRPGKFLHRWVSTRTRTREEGIGAVAVEQHINYKHELLAGDIVTIRSGVVEVKDKVLRLFHEMRNEETGELAATMTVVAIHIDVHARKARALPEDIRERALNMLMGASGDFAGSQEAHSDLAKPSCFG